VSFPACPLRKKPFLLKLFFRGEQFSLFWILPFWGSALWKQLTRCDAWPLYGNSSKTLTLTSLSPPTCACHVKIKADVVSPWNVTVPPVYRNVYLNAISHSATYSETITIFKK
jgi:hypothetical protein